MKILILWLSGYCRVTVKGVDPQVFLNRLTRAHLPFWNMAMTDEFTMEICVSRKRVQEVLFLAEQCMYTAQIVSRHGAPEEYGGLRRRWVLLLSMTLVALMTAILPQYVWFYSVEGNVTVPTQAIIRAVQASGVDVGTYGKDIVPQTVKNQVLALLPELSWLTIQQSGGRAVIVVREKVETPQISDRRQVQDMVASRDGVIDEISVLDGAALVKKGQAVSAGDILISGYIDLEYKIRATGALGEIYAFTAYPYTAVTPSTYEEKTYTGEEKTVYYLTLGKYRIKISRSSGISAVKCDKMTETKQFTLPGGFSLPIGLCCETYRSYETAPVALSPETAKTLMEQEVLNRIQSTMVAGTILQHTDALQEDGSLYRLAGLVQCREMIGRFRNAELLRKDGTTWNESST